MTPAVRRNLVERRITEAMQRGDFDNLPGQGKPLDIERPPAKNEDLWWVLKIMRQANVVPDEIRYRKRIDQLRDQLSAARTEREVRGIIGELNEQLAVAIPEEDFETVGGFISSLSGKVPAAGERLSYENLDFYVTAADARRVKQVRVTVKPDGRGEAKD